MFDNRMEITSPGGMMNGSRIQDMDLHRVPSMRRNEVISDIFGRLRLMERRGSGIGRILSSYSGFLEQPEFFSNEFFFLVCLPNRSMAVSAQMELTFIPADSESQLSEEKSQLSEEKSQLSKEKSQLSKEKSQLSKEKTFSEIEVEDKELGAFKRYVQQKTDNEFRNNTIEKVLKLFSRYRYEYSFNRRNIADLFSISENGASAFLKKFIDKGIIGKRKKDEYYFINPEG